MKYRWSQFLTLGLIIIVTAPFVQARTWTSAADSSKRFEAEYVGFKANVVTVRMRSGTPAAFPLNALSQADRDFVLSQAGDTSGKPTVDVLGVLKDQLITAADGTAKPFSFKKGKEPSHFLLYVSAYW
jgi:hypothetical protein